jgi:HEAT repeat protein
MIGLQLLGEEKSIQHFQQLLPVLTSASLPVARQAMRSTAKVTTPHCRKYAKALISLLRSSKDIVFRKSCLIAIGKLEDVTLIHDIIAASLHFRQSERRLIETMIRKIGITAAPMLLASTKDQTLPDRCRALAGRILGHLALPQLHSSLYDIVQVEADRAYFYFSHYHGIQSRYPDKDLTLLVEALLTGYHSVTDFIIQLLCSAGEVEDADLLLRLYRNPDIRIRSQVIETLEKTCDRKIFRMLRQLIEDVPPEEMLRTYYQRRTQLMPLNELLDKMSRSSSPVDQIAALATMYQLQMPELADALKRQTLSQEELFQHFAQELLA